MTRQRASLRLHECLTVALIALALLGRVLVPPGWMPAEGQGFAITLCPSAAPMPAMPGMSDAHGKMHHDESGKGSTSDHPCAFAGFGAPMLGGDPPAPAAPLSPPRDRAASRELATPAIGRGLAAPPPPATGPPTRI